MRVVSADEIDSALAYPAFVDTLEAAFREGVIAPPRHHHTIRLDGGEPDATLLLMPAWTRSPSSPETAGKYIGLKSVTVFPGNGKHSLPAIQGAYLLISAKTGIPLALMDAPRLTQWRTAAASALAARMLARADTFHLVLLGAGALGAFLVRAHVSVLPITRVTIWNRTRGNADRLVQSLGDLAPRVDIMATDDLEAAIRKADLVSTATLSRTPLVRGEWLPDGVHLDCVGAFKPDMRETDDEVVRRARIWVDTLAGGFAEAGDIVIPLADGTIGKDKIEGDLFALVRGTAPRRASDREITMFKSVGASIEDLTAAIAVWERLSA